MQIVIRVRVPQSTEVLHVTAEQIKSVDVGAVSMTPVTFLQALQVGANAMQPGGLDAFYRRTLFSIAADTLDPADDHCGRNKELAQALQLQAPYTMASLHRAAIRDGLNPSELWPWMKVEPFDQDPPRPAA